MLPKYTTKRDRRRKRRHTALRRGEVLLTAGIPLFYLVAQCEVEPRCCVYFFCGLDFIDVGIGEFFYFVGDFFGMSAQRVINDQNFAKVVVIGYFFFFRMQT